MRWFWNLMRRISCRRHRWRRHPVRPDLEWCDLCRAKRRRPWAPAISR